jgi:large subunit ribosomal protein L17
MRHNKTINQLGRKADHRKAMMANMAASLILHKKISTTLAKAKALRVYVEPLITKSKEDSTHSRRTVFSYLGNKEAVTELFREVSKKIADRPGGYTRILKTGSRLGDNADMCIIELVDYNELMLGEKETKTAAKATRRRRPSGAKKTTEQAVEVKEEKKASKPKAKKTEEIVEEAEPETEVIDETEAETEMTVEAEVEPEVEAEVIDQVETIEEPEIKEEPETDETTEDPKKEE